MAEENPTEENLLDVALENSRDDDDSYVLAETDDVSDLTFDDNVEDPELEALKARVKEMEDEAEKLKELNKEVEDSIMSPTSGSGGSSMVEDKGEVDARSIYVGNVDYSATPEEIKQHFHGVGFVNRVTILCDKYSGHPKGYAYVEFADKDSVENATALNDSLFKGRQIKVVAKRTNMPGLSSTDRGGYRGRGGRGRFRGHRGGYGSPYFTPRGRGRGGYRGRRAAYYSPY